MIRAAETTRATVPVYQPQPEPLAALTRRVKESFDPKHVLNPGRMYEGV
jgi:glycolate oxidase FAD binding subunit